MIRIKDYIFNENEIVKIQFDDGSKEMEIDHTNGNSTFIDGTFNDIEWNYGTTELEELKLDYSAVVSGYKKLEEKNKKLKDELELKDFNYTTFRHLEESNDILKEELEESEEKVDKLEDRIDKAIEYIEEYQDVLKEHNGDWLNYQDGFKPYLLKILKGEKNEKNNDTNKL